jgi:hypothetical protein
MDRVLYRKNECHELDPYRHEASRLMGQNVRRKINPHGNTATFLTGIDLPTRYPYPLEGAGLVDPHDREEKSA